MTGKFEKLHLGCGPKIIPGFCHIDAVEMAHVQYKSDIRHLPFIPDNSANLVYASHVLEHFGRWEIIDVLTEWYRVLAPGGTLRLAVPDFSACAKIYHEQGLTDGLSGLIGLVCGGQKDQYDYHKAIFDQPYLTGLLTSVGFSSVERWDWRDTEHAQIDDYSQAYLPHMDKENGLLMSLNLQALK